MGSGPDIGELWGLTADHVVRISTGTSPGELTDQKDRGILRHQPEARAATGHQALPRIAPARHDEVIE
jgi:hypothetical protein